MSDSSPTTSPSYPSTPDVRLYPDAAPSMTAAGRLACRLTLDRLFDGLGVGACDGLADVVAGCPVLIGDAGWASGTGPVGFRRTGWNGDLRSEVAKSAAYPGGSQPSGWAGPFPGAAQIDGQVTGQAQLGVRGDDQPGPAVGGGGVTQFGRARLGLYDALARRLVADGLGRR